MANLGEIQKKLNEDESFQKAFMNDPAGTLEKEGLELSDEMKQELEQSIKEIQATGKAPSGASVKPAGGIMISISKSF